MRFSIVHFNRSLVLNRNFVCEKCGLIIKPRTMGSQSVRGNLNVIVFADRLDAEHRNWRTPSLTVNICKTCAEPFAEVYRLRNYVRVLQTCWGGLVEQAAPETGLIDEAEIEDARQLDRMQSQAFARYQAGIDAVTALIPVWWPELEAKVLAHEQKVMPAEPKAQEVLA